ncbi:DUF4132 domain-containing protein [Glycomyces artemisiae]|uniref:Uncharacterized protein DUF4132 n=1 Tax=Glycomyces artemisiae TaxID=1076443 RepID=A0A2T0UFC7_9ACTN|nr:DUF4132 domain-containing protein [Glycomyces artemisiae]PRY56574.1 uncharacterized protein DUF4132 [Glycomyces artemisiae]
MVLLPDEPAWLLEAGADFMQSREHSYNDDFLWLSFADADQIAAVGLADADDPWLGYNALLTLVATLGTDALPVLTGPVGDAYPDYHGRGDLMHAIAMLPSDDAAAHLLTRLDLPSAFKAATKAAAAFPLRTLRTAARLAADTTEPAELAAIAALADPALRVHLTDAERAALDRLAAATGRVPDADDLPPLLTSPPWTRKRPKAIVIDGLEPPADASLVWADGERDAWNALPDPDDHNAFWLRSFGELPGLDAYGWRLTPFLAYGDMEQAAPRLADWQGTEPPDHPGDLRRILARFGERVLDRVLLQAPGPELPGPILSLTAARLTAARLDTPDRAHAHRWLDRHGLAAVPYLVPDALGADNDLRRRAAAALTHLATRHGTDAVVAAAPYGPEAARALRPLLGDDPLTPSVKVPKPGAWFVPSALPQVLTAGRDRALPIDAVGHLATVLALATPDYPYPGLAVVAETCDRESLAAFGLALFEQWCAAGAPAKDGWALTQLAHFPSDAAAVRLAELVRAWPEANKHKRAAAGLAVLGALGTEAALRALHDLSEKLKFKGLKDEAGRRLTAAAERLGLRREQLADRLVPDLGLGAPIVLDYGPRTFTVEADEHLALRVTDGTGKVLKALPKPGAKDDADAAGEAYRRYTALKKDLRTVAGDQVRRLEAAMVAARTWSVPEFEALIAGHPLNRRLARRLVWWTGTGSAATGFRIAEDGSYADADDARVALPADARVRLAHPVLLGERTGDWIALFADYELLQPFDQLARPALALTDEERATGGLARAEGAVIEAVRVLGATGQGWQRAKPEDAGVEPGLTWSPGGGLTVAVALEPGIWAGAATQSPDQTVRSAVVSRGEPCWWFDERRPPRPVDLDPVTASEILARLERLTTSGGGPAA